jgi:ADP-ribosylglycohydrolase
MKIDIALCVHQAGAAVMRNSGMAGRRAQEIVQRAVACFKGLCTGDAMGKQTETLSRADVLRWYPGGLTGFHGRPGDVIPRYEGKRYRWRIGETTDDTEQTLAVARALLTTRRVEHTSIGRELLKCSKSVHPGVSMWRFVQTGDASHIAPDGDGCGAAMRTAPVGVMYPPGRANDIVRGAYECAVPTHGGQSAIAAAAAVAAAVSFALEGCRSDEVLQAAIEAARDAEAFRPPTRPHSIAESIASVYADLSQRVPLSAGPIAAACFPNRPETIVPLAISLALLTESAEDTILIAANVGGDADSVASIGGALAAALRPGTVNERWFDVVRSVNEDDITGVAESLAALRMQI